MKVTTLGVLSVLVFLYSCLAQEAPPIAQANNRFSKDVAEVVLGAAPDKNVVFSPFSLFSALTMTDAGAKGTTKTEMDSVLHLTDSGLDLSEGSTQVPQAYKTLVDSFSLTSGPEAPDQHQMSIANGMWLDMSFSVLPNFRSIVTDYFDAEVQEVDFAGNPAGATNDINNWIANKTNNRIQDLIPEGAINSMTATVLANAIYLKAPWAKTFDNATTSQKEFTALAKDSAGALTSKKVQVDMMQQTDTFRVGKLEGYSAIDLPYVSASGLSMLIIVPDQAETLVDLESKVWTDAAFMANTLAALKDTRVELWLPKFEFDYSFSAKEVLQALGMQQAFTDSADFSGIADTSQGNLTISDVLHKAFISVDENGTEAAAATAVIVSVTSAVEETVPELFHIDRPFIPVIYHQSSGTILFAGHVTDPSAGRTTS